MRSSLLLAAMAATAPTLQAASLRTDYLHSELIAEHASVRPGERVRIGLQLRHDPHWHTYWINPGDSGLPTRFDWRLPVGARIEPLGWPGPQRFDLGGIVNYGYGDDVVLPFELQLPSHIDGDSIELGLDARWLICAEECLPGRGAYTLTLAIANEAPSAPDPRFADSLQRLPSPLSTTAQLRIDAARRALTLQLDAATAPAGIELWEVFPEAPRLADHALQPRFAREGDHYRLHWPLNAYSAGAPSRSLWTLFDGHRYWQLRADTLP